MRILVMNGQGGDGVVALVEREPASGRTGSLLLVQQREQPGRGGATRLTILLRDMLDAAGWEIGSLGLVAVVTGPGSFTGLRATLALAQGIALGSGVALQGVATGEALRRTLYDVTGNDMPGDDASLPVWCVSMARRDRVFLERDDGGPEAFMLDDVPNPAHPVRLAGDGAALLAARIEAAGGRTVLSHVVRPDMLAIAAVALDRLEGRLAPLAALPLYVDAPEAKRPSAGLRPAPE